MKRLLVIRFSALGDVAMTVPTLYALATQYPDLDITILSRPFCAPFFERLPANVHFMAADFHGRHKGFVGLNRLLHDIDIRSFDYIADFHDVLRTKWLRFIGRLCGKRIAVIDKGRAGKRALVRQRNRRLIQQKTSFQRYADVLCKLGFATHDTFQQLDFADLYAETTPTSVRRIGIAPFAKHRGKIYPIDRMERVISTLSAQPGITIFLFGAGADEQRIIDRWCRQYDHTYAASGKQQIAHELALMAQLDVMLTMDSANMHMASLVGTRVVSIWGATHPYAGFLGWQQKPDDCIQTALPCRPCSIFGNKPCLRGDYACLNTIAPDTIVAKLLEERS
ncbi:MAG: glycosyltransferase family 9 protein [Paludibacteraceae bacterium]